MSKPDQFSGINGEATIVRAKNGEHGEPRWDIAHLTDGEVYRIPGFTDWHCARQVAIGLVTMDDNPGWDEVAQDWCEDR